MGSNNRDCQAVVVDQRRGGGMNPGPRVRWGGVKGGMRWCGGWDEDDTSAPLTDALILLGHLQAFDLSEIRDWY